MNYGNLAFSKPGSDEIELKVPWVPETATLVRCRLEEADNHSFDGDPGPAVGTYSAFYNAELMGHRLVDLPDVSAIKPSDVMAAMYQYGFQLVDVPERAEGELSEAEANPTGTTVASS